MGVDVRNVITLSTLCGSEELRNVKSGDTHTAHTPDDDLW